MYSSRLDIPDHTRKQAIGCLQARLSDALDLEAQAKQAHWNVRGKDFIQLHEFFDRMHTYVEELADTLAERIAALGGIADGRVRSTAEASSLYEAALQTHSGEEHLRSLAGALAQLAKAVRNDVGLVVEDVVTADVLAEAARGLDKYLWLVEAHLT